MGVYENEYGNTLIIGFINMSSKGAVCAKSERVSVRDQIILKYIFRRKLFDKIGRISLITSRRVQYDSQKSRQRSARRRTIGVNIPYEAQYEPKCQNVSRERAY